MISDSWTCVTSAAIASDCGEIIFPMTPPIVLAARKRSGEMFANAGLDVAAMYCNPANSAFADVSEPVTAVPTQPMTGEMKENADPDPARKYPMDIVWPEKFMT